MTLEEFLPVFRKFYFQTEGFIGDSGESAERYEARFEAHWDAFQDYKIGRLIMALKSYNNSYNSDRKFPSPADIKEEFSQLPPPPQPKREERPFTEDDRLANEALSQMAQKVAYGKITTEAYEEALAKLKAENEQQKTNRPDRVDGVSGETVN